MTKKILYVHQSLKETQQAEIKDLATNFKVRFKDDTLSPAELAEIEILFGWPGQLGEEILALPQSSLKWIQAISAGVDYIDLKKLQEKNILLSNGSGIHAIPIAESVLGMLLARARVIQASVKAQSQKEWLVKPSYDELHGKKMLIIGAGQIGQRLAKISKALGIETYGVNRSGRQLKNFVQVYPQSDFLPELQKMDIIVNILPLTGETTYFYNEEFFQQTKPGAYFINVGRGPSVKTEDLIAALENGQIGFAGLDVFEEEPLTKESPLWEMENVLITPHASGMARHFSVRLTEIFKDNLETYQDNGQLHRNQVDLTSGY